MGEWSFSFDGYTDEDFAYISSTEDLQSRPFGELMALICKALQAAPFDFDWTDRYGWLTLNTSQWQELMTAFQQAWNYFVYHLFGVEQPGTDGEQ